MRQCRLLLLSGVLLAAAAAPLEAAISRIGNCAAQTTSCTFSVAPSSGDAIVVFAHRDGNTTAPTLPTGYAPITNAGASVNSARLGLKISDGTETTTAVWTNATSIAAVIYRGANVSPLGNFANGSAADASIAYNTFTLNVTTSTSWVVGFAAHRTATNVGTAPSGMTLVTSATDIAVSDTNAAVSSWSTQTVGVNASSGWESYTVELLATTGEDTAKLYVDDYINMNTADANGTTLTSAIMNSSTQGPDNAVWTCYDDNTNMPGTTPAHTIDAHQWNAPGTIRVRSTSTDYAVGSTAKTERFTHTSVNFHTCRMEGLGTTRHRGAVTVAGWILLAPPDDGVSGNLYDYWRVDNLDGNFCVAQLNNGDGGTGYHLRIESNPGGVTVQSANIAGVTPATRYWMVLYCNFQARTSSLAVYDTSKVQVGSTVTGSLAYTAADNPSGAYIDVIRVGQGEVQTDAATTIWEHTIIDYSAAKFPLGPVTTGGAQTRMLLGVGQ